MDEADSTLPDPVRDPRKTDVIQLCRELNRLGARYIVVGGFAVMQQGYERATKDVDILVEDSPENQRLVFSAMETLSEKAILELQGDDLRNYIVVRVADEFLVDLMTRANGISYAEARDEIDWFEEEGLRIPYASKKLLWRTKQTHREKDELDRIFLRKELAGVLPEEELYPAKSAAMDTEGFLRRLWRKIW